MWSILYTATDGPRCIYHCGPFHSEQLALAYVKEHNEGPDKDYLEAEFNVARNHIYLLDPGHNMRELEEADIQ